MWIFIYVCMCVCTARGEQHADTAAFHHFLAKAYIGLKDGVAAEKSLEEARKIYEPYGYRNLYLSI